MRPAPAPPAERRASTSGVGERPTIHAPLHPVAATRGGKVQPPGAGAWPTSLTAMTAIDWVIVALTILLAFYGYLQGFLVGGLSLLGFALGAFLGTRVGPLLLPGGSHSHYAALFGLVGALLAGGVLASGFEGVGMRARTALRLPGLRTVDGL